MEPVKKFTGKVAPIDRVNVDTDAIVPARYLKLIERTGWGQYLFYDWAHENDGSLKEDFVLNKPVFKDAEVLVVGQNFGSGSSREHAVWAIAQAGYKAIVTTSLADIFHKNLFENGVVPVFVPEDVLASVMEKAQTIPDYQLTVDLEKGEIYDESGLQAELDVHPDPESQDISGDQQEVGVHSSFVVHRDPDTHVFRTHTLLNGLDEVGLTLQHEDAITAYEKKRHVAGD